MKQTTYYIEIHSKEHQTLQQNTNHKFGTKFNSDLRKRREDTGRGEIFGRGKKTQDNTFDKKLDINLLRERRRAGDRHNKV